MDTDDEQHFQRMIDGLRGGDDAVVREFCDRYSDALERIAGKHLARPLRRRLDPQDIVQSAFRTFLRRVAGGQFQLAGSESLWRLLCTITLTKVREQARFHLRKKRGLDREVDAAPVLDESGTFFYDPVDRAPTPEAAVEFAEQFRKLLQSLGPEEQRVVELRLQDAKQEEIAAELQCSERTVRRLLERVRARLESAAS